MPQFIKPELDGQRVAYKDDRFWIIEITPDRPFQEASHDMAEYAVWDGGEDYTIAYAKKAEDGGFDIWVPYGQHAVYFHCSTIEELGPTADREGVKLYERASGENSGDE